MRAAGGALASVALGTGFAALGGTFDAEPLFVGGIAFVALGAVALVWVGLAGRGARVSRELEAHRVVEDEPFDVRLVATSPLPVPGGELVEPLLAGPVPLHPGRRATRIRIEARFARRGLRRLAPPRLSIHDPLRLASRTVSGHGAVSGREAASAPAGEAFDEVLVLPRVEPVAVTAEPDASGSGRALASLAGMAEVEMDGLRAYREGTAASRIHWPPLARGAGLMERRLRPDGDGRPLVVLDPRGGTEADLDAAVRAAASLCRALAASGGCALLLPGERRASRVERDLGAWPAAWARLALVEPGAPPPLAGLATRIGPVFYVAGGPPARIPRALRNAPGIRILVVPAQLPERQEVLTVAGCHGYALSRPGARVRRAAA